MLRLKKVDTFPLTVPVSYPQGDKILRGSFNCRARFMTREAFDEVQERAARGEMNQTDALLAMIEDQSWSLVHDETGEKWTAEEIVADIYLPPQILSAFLSAQLDALGKTPRRSR